MRLSTAIILVLLVLHPVSILGQGGSLPVQPNAMSVGVAGSTVALPYDPSSSYWNPANIVFLTTNRIMVSLDERSFLHQFALSKFMPPSTSVGFNLFRSSSADLATFALAYRVLPYLSLGGNFNFSKTIYQRRYSSLGFGLLFRTQPDYRSRTSSSETLWKWLRSPAMRERFSLGIAIQNLALAPYNQSQKHQIQLGTMIKPLRVGPQIHFATHFINEERSFHLGTVTTISDHLTFFAGVHDFKIKQFSTGLAISLGAFEIDLSYDHRKTQFFGSALLRLSDDRKSLFLKYRQQANQQLQDNNLSEASKSYAKALAYDPGDEDIQFLIPMIQHQSNETAQKIDSLYKIASSFEAKGWYINAFLAYKKMIELDQHNRKARNRLKSLNSRLHPYLEQIFQQGVAYYEESNIKRAQLVFEKILLVNAHHEGAKNYLAKIDSINIRTANDYYFRGLGYFNQRNFIRAYQEFKSALSWSPNHKEAKEYLQKTERELMAVNQRIQDYLAEAKNHEDNQRYSKAAISYRKVLELDRNHQYARTRLAALSNQIRRELDERFNRARRYYDEMNYSAAVKLLQENLAIDPEHQPSKNYLRLANQKLADLAEQHYARAQSFYYQKKWDMALQECSLALSLNSNHAGSKELQKMVMANISLDKLLERGRSFYEKGDYLNARTTFRQILQNDPLNSDARNYLDRIEADLSERCEELFNLGMVKYTEANYEEAIEEWRKILAINPEHKSAKEYIQKAEERLEALKKIE